MVKFNSVRAPSLQADKLYVCQVWHTRSRREVKLVRVREVIGERIKDGMTVITDRFTAVTDGVILCTEIEGRMCRVTFGILGEELPLLLEGPKQVQETVEELVEKAVAKATRKALTPEQKARKNELARARRAAAKEAVAA